VAVCVSALGVGGVAFGAGAHDVPAVFTSGQAARGNAVYVRQCQVCHGASMEGVVGPALRGAPFHQMAAAQNLDAQSLLSLISSTMPQDNPGSLTPDQYAAVTAYILQQNNYPAGNVALSDGAQNLEALNLSQ
jgi:mono/diheme cytochrome c family protein